MSTLPSGLAMLLFLAAAGPERLGPIQPTPSEIESFQIPHQTEISIPDGGSPIFQISGVGLFAASAADFATTEWGMSRGLREGNPVASQRGVRLVHHVIGPALVYWTTERLQKNGNRKLALGLRLGLMAAYGYASIHNLRQTSSGARVP